MKKKTVAIAITSTVVATTFAALPNIMANELTYTNLVTDNTNSSTSDAYLYLSDLGYVSSMSNTSWSNIKTNTNVNGGTITLNFDGEILEFEKGIGAHATSNVVFDVSEYSNKYTRFTTYAGVDKGQGNKGDGVKFTVLTSMDGKTWTEVVKTDAIKGNENSVFIDIDITGVKYIKLYADDNGWNANDHAVYGSPRIMKADYDITTEYIGGIKTVSQYDNMIKSKYSIDQEITGEYEQLLLQRTFVKRVGFNTLQTLMKSGTEAQTAITWLLNNPEALKLYITGGEVEGTYKKSMEHFINLYTNYHTDFNDVENGDLYLKMVISLSLSHSKTIKLWTGTGEASDPCIRYETYKDFYHNGTMQDGGNKELFKSLPVELMRWVMDNQLSDEETTWLADYALNQKTQGKSYLDAYNYISYTFDYNYSDPKYYDEANYDQWNEKYNISSLSGYGTSGLQRLWMVFDSGSVCGGLAKTYANLGKVFGTPAAGIGQPGHAATLAYSQNAEGKGIWRIQNDVSGWTQSEKGERMLLGWGSKNWDSHYNVPYIFLGQYALDDFDNLVKAQYYNLLADVYKGDTEKQVEIYNKALEAQKFNLDSLVGLIDTYKLAGTKTSQDFLDLSKKVADGLKFYPLPFVDVMNLISANITDDSDVVTFDMLKTQTLKAATKATEGDTTQYRECINMANYLLGSHQVELASFSFNGENANTIMINDKYENSSIRWEYSLDGWATKAETDAKQLTLTAEELALVNAEHDIQISLVGSSDIYTIDITQHETPSKLYLNDLENQFRGFTSPLEYSADNGETWITYDSENTRITGDTPILLRYIASGTKMQSEVAEYTFTEDNQPSSRKYITLNNVKLHTYSSQENSTGAAALNMIDGNGLTGWHNRFSGESDKYYSVEFDQVRAITSIEYKPSGNNGKLRDADIYTSMDGETWEKAGEVRGLANNLNLKTLNLDESTMTKYIKIQAVGTHGNPNDAFFTGSMLNFFEDLDYSLPKIKVEEPAIVKVGQPLDDMFGTYSAKDVEDGDLTSLVQLSGDVNFNKPGEYPLTYSVTDSDGNTVSTTRNIIVIDTDDLTYLSDMDWNSANSGWGSVRKDLSASQKALRLTDEFGLTVTYERGIGTHATSTIVYDLTDQGYDLFTSYVGVDHEMYNSPYASVIFQVYVDGVKVADTGVMTGKTPQQFLEINLHNAKELKLVVTDSGNGISADHATWGDAKLYFANEERAELDFTAINNLLAEVELLNAEDYTASSWDYLTRIVEQAETALAEGVNQSTINNVVEKLTQAKYNLISVADFENLQQLVAQANELTSFIHTEATWTTLSDALQIATDLIAQDTPTVDEVSASLDALQTAIENLAVRENKVALRNLIENTILDETLYTEANFASFEKVKAASVVVYENLGATDVDVTNAIASFEEALQILTSPSLENVQEFIATPLHENFDLRANIKAVDPEDGDLTATIQIDGEVNIDKAGTYDVTYSVTDSKNQTTSKTVQIMVYSATTYLSDLEWTSGRTDYDRIYKDVVGSSSLKLLVDGEIQEFAKGFKAHANAEIVYNLEGSNYEYFQTYVGVDKNMAENNNASIIFKVFADGEEVYNSGMMKHQTNAKFVQVPVTGVKELKLVIDNGGNGNTADHGIFGDTKFLITNSLPTLEIEKSISTKVGLPIEDIFGTYSATDAEDGDLTENIEVNGEVDFNKPGEYPLTYSVTDSDGNTVSTTRTIAVVDMQDFAYASDVDWKSANSGWGLVRKDLSASQKALRLTNAEGKEVVYEKGIGTHATSTVIYDLSDKNYDYFTSYVGVDREMYNSVASIVFQVFVDGVKVADTGVMTAKMPQQFLEIDINDAKELKLVVTDSGNGNGSDHATWGDAKLHFANNEREGINRTELDELLTHIESLNASDYTAASIDNLMTVKTDLLSQLVSGYTQEIIDTVTVQLKEAVTALELVTNYDELITLVAEAQSLDLISYTAESVATLNEVLTQATQVLESQTSTQTAVNQLIQSLKSAIENLELAVDFNQVVTIKDQYLKADIKKALNLTSDSITIGDLYQLTTLKISNLRVSSLEGLEYAVNLQSLAPIIHENIKNPLNP